MKHLTLVMLVLAISVNYAQDGEKSASIEKILEIDCHPEDEGEVISLEENGLLFIAKNREEGGLSKVAYSFDFYDKELVKRKSYEVILKKAIERDKFAYGDGKFCQFFLSSKGDFRVEIIDVKTMESDAVEGSLPKYATILDMKMSGDLLYATIKGGKHEKLIMVLNVKDKSKKIIPITVDKVKPRNIRIKRLQVMEDTKEVLVLYSYFGNKVTPKVILLRMSAKGEIKEKIELYDKEDIYFVDLSVGAINDNEIIFQGTYMRNETRLEGAEGVFFARFSEDAIQDFKLKKFTDMGDFESYMLTNHQNKVDRKEDKAKDKGKELVVHYHIADHDMLKLDDGYLFVGEVYTPTYHMETKRSSDGKITTDKVFDGNFYTHGVMVRFSNTGDIVWNMPFGLGVTDKPKEVKRFVSLNEEALKNGQIDLLIPNFNFVSMSIGSNGDVISERSSNKFSTSYDQDKLGYFDRAGVAHWYDNYFLTYRYQIIKNKEEEDVKNKRAVMLINKVKF